MSVLHDDPKKMPSHFHLMLVLFQSLGLCVQSLSIIPLFHLSKGKVVINLGVSAHVHKKESTFLIRICVYAQIIQRWNTLLSKIIFRNFCVCTQKTSTSLLRICLYAQKIQRWKTLLFKIPIRNFCVCTQKLPHSSQKDLSIALNNHGQHGLFSFLSSLSISVLLNLELGANKLYITANKLYKAALLTNCYVHHFLSPYIDSEVNHKRHFIKIPFTNKGMEFIDLHSIFKDNLVIPSIPKFLDNSETPIIYHTHNKPIWSTVFNFNKIVTDI